MTARLFKAKQPPDISKSPMRTRYQSLLAIVLTTIATLLPPTPGANFCLPPTPINYGPGAFGLSATPSGSTVTRDFNILIQLKLMDVEFVNIGPMPTPASTLTIPSAIHCRTPPNTSAICCQQHGLSMVTAREQCSARGYLSVRPTQRIFHLWE
jgi:hypothetical protein